MFRHLVKMNKEHMMTEISPLHCPITRKTFRDPVVAEDGHTYERHAIINWLAENMGTSPKTQEVLNVKRLIPNLLVKRLIDEQFETTLRKQDYKYKLGEDIKQLDRLFETYGKSVHAAEWIKKSDGPAIVLMQIDGARALKEAMFYVEMSKHPHIVRTYGLVDNPDDEVMLVQERAQNDNLLQLLKKRQQPPSAIILKEIFIQIADGMSFLAHNNIVHGDLACRNILVYKYNEGDPKQILVKVTDFGLSRVSAMYKSVSTSTSTTFNIIPYRYVAPEILREPESKEFSTEKSDMYSMGVLMCEAYSFRGKQPWAHIEDDSEVMRRVIKGERLQQPPTCCNGMWSLIETTMYQEPKDRPIFTALHRQLIKLIVEIPTPYILPSKVEKALQAIKENSTTIDLSRASLHDKEIKIIAEALKANKIVSSLCFDRNSISNEGAIAIAEMLEVNKTINKVSLNRNDISFEGVARLAQALTVNQTLVDLNIANNPLGDHGIEAICETLKTNKKLKTLIVHATHISLIGIKALAEMCKKNCSIEHLSIGQNSIADDGAQLIAEALKVNSSIRWLDMASLEVTDIGALALAKAIKSHRRKIDYFFLIEDPPMSDEGRNAIKNALLFNEANNR